MMMMMMTNQVTATTLRKLRRRWLRKIDKYACQKQLCLGLYERVCILNYYH